MWRRHGEEAALASLGEKVGEASRGAALMRCKGAGSCRGGLVRCAGRCTNGKPHLSAWSGDGISEQGTRERPHQNYIVVKIYLIITLYISFIFYICWVPTISVPNLTIFHYYSNPLLRRRRLTRILWWGVLGYVLPRLLFRWSYEVFCYSISLRIIKVFRDIIYIIIIFYSWHLIIEEYFWPYVWNNWSWITIST
jgi:hypothetical protein